MTASTMVNQSTMPARPSCHVTAAIRPSEATFTPSRNAPDHEDFRNLGKIWLRMATKKNEGRKIANVASNADCQPPIRYPAKVALVDIGPGVI